MLMLAKSEFRTLQQKIFETDTELNQIELQFYRAVNSKAVELEGITEDQEKELDHHQHLYEMQELARLEKRLKIFEKKKIALLQ